MELNSYRAFTTVELLIALAFIGALGGVAYSVFNENHEPQRDEKRVEVINELKEELAIYFSEYGGYPSSLNALSDVWRAQNGYHYAALGEGCTSYHLGVKLEDEDSSFLVSDADAMAAAIGTNCPDGGTSDPDFFGADPVYDVKP